MSTRIITLTGRPPVKISDENWPQIAGANDSEHDGQIESQANCKSSWLVKVRRHADGRAIVYAVYSYTTTWCRPSYDARRGTMLPTTTTERAICEAIRDVCDDMARAEHADGDESRWPTLAAECIADMPAEELT